MDNYQTHKGFWISSRPETDLGLAILMIEGDEKNYEPIAVAVNISESKELRERLHRLERDEGPGLCAWVYKL
jgi:hypothetical protein